MAEVRRRGWVVLRGEVYDLHRFVDRHPGGAALRHLAGTDATLVIANAHGKSARLARTLARFRVGSLDPATVDPFERDLLRLHDELDERGLFAYPRAWLVGDALRIGGLFALGLVLARFEPRLGFVALAAASIDLVWWIHDAGHDAVFASERVARAVIEALGVLFLGMPQRGYHYGVHRLHHGFVNVIGADLALDTGPVVWDARSGRSGAPTALRPLLWFAVIVPVAFPALLWTALSACWQKRQHAVLALVAVRWAVVIGVVFRGQWALAVGPPAVAGAVLAFMAGLNHFHLPMSTSGPPSPARAVLERTQNVNDEGRFWTWLSGGLNFHIEHHLFATMPSRNYRLVAPHVRALCAAHALPYHTCGKLKAIGNLYRKLRTPLTDVPRDGAPPRDAEARA